MFCWKCGAELDLPTKLSFRAECDKCGVPLHTCKQCIHWEPGKPNECNVPDTDYIRDREARNLCEEFEAKKEKTSPRANSNNKFDDLFFN